VKLVDSSSLKFQFDKEPGALKYEVRDLLRRALSIARAMGLDQTAASEPRAMVADLRAGSFENRFPVPALWFGHLDLDFGVSDPGEVGKSVETLIGGLAPGTDGPHHRKSLAYGVSGFPSGQKGQRPAPLSIGSCRAARAYGWATADGDDQRDPSRLHRQDAQVAIAARYLAEDRAVTG